MAGKFTITIEVEGGVQTATIKDDAGTEKVVNGLALFGYDQSNGNLYTFCWGKPTDAAYAVGEGLAQTTFRGDPFYIDFYKALLMQMCIRTGNKPEQNLTPEEAEARWAANQANPECKAARCDCAGPCEHKKAILGEEAIVEREDAPDDSDPNKWN